MQHTVILPGNKSIEISYNKGVYSPEYSMLDTIYLAHSLLKMRGEPCTILDIGCGSGVLGLSLKYLFPKCTVTLTDVDPEAVKMTRKNSEALGLRVGVFNKKIEEMCEAELIVANLPTFDDKQMKMEKHGPDVAYYGGEDGLDLYRTLFKNAACKFLVCECQEARQEEFLKASEGWELVARSKQGFVFTREARPTPARSKPKSA